MYYRQGTDDERACIKALRARSVSACGSRGRCSVKGFCREATVQLTWDHGQRIKTNRSGGVVDMWFGDGASSRVAALGYPEVAACHEVTGPVTYLQAPRSQPFRQARLLHKASFSTTAAHRRGLGTCCEITQAYRNRCQVGTYLVGR